MDFGIIDDLLIKYGALVKNLKWKNWNTVGHTSAIYRLQENL
jgi:hypothetical protein